jgi:hypothetical protein
LSDDWFKNAEKIVLVQDITPTMPRMLRHVVGHQTKNRVGSSSSGPQKPGCTPEGYYEVACEMERRDQGPWLGEDVVMALDFGVESLIELIKIYKVHPTLLRR